MNGSRHFTPDLPASQWENRERQEMFGVGRYWRRRDWAEAIVRLSGAA